MSRDALVVGINSYRKLSKLQTPARDAEAIAQCLETHGEFVVTRLPEEVEGNALRMHQKSNVKLIELKKAISNLFKPDSEQAPDTALLYFSGHGFRENEGRREEYFATSDWDPELGNYGLSMEWLQRILKESPVRQQIVWLDCCHAGGLLDFDQADPGSSGKARDRSFVASSRDFEKSYEGINSPYSVLTKLFLDGLDPARYPSGWVSNYDLIVHIQRNLKGVTQRPIFHNSGGFINLTCKKGVSTNIPVTVAPTDVCPYKGLSSFDFNDEDPKYFFGRTKLTDELVDKVRQGNFLAVLGPSGNGKSSVVRAGLLHELKLGQRLSGSDDWAIRIIRPGENPMESLAEGLVDSILPPKQWALKWAEIKNKLEKESASGFAELVRSISETRLVLVVDQFEEAFTLCKDLKLRQQFFECLLEVLPLLDQRICLVITMRADFLGKCMEQEYSGLSGWIDRNLIGVAPMAKEDLRQAIVEPARVTGLELEPELVVQILIDVAGASAALPLMQDALEQLWKNRVGNRLVLNTYTELGGLEGTLSRRADQVYESFAETPNAQAAVRHVFIFLTQPGEGTEDTRRRVFKSALVNDLYSAELIEGIVQRLADEKLVVTGGLTEKNDSLHRAEVVDVVHEALIRRWPLLQGWIDESRDYLIQVRKLEAAAKEWQDKNQSGDFLLRGTRLIEAEAVPLKMLLPLSMQVKNFIACSKRQELLERLRYGIKELQPHELEELGKNLENSDLRRADLRGADLHGFNLIRANLSGADLIGANLREANLRGADLTGTNLIGFDLSGADLTGTNLREANLSGANLTGTNLREAKLSGANLTGTNLREANLSGANLTGTNLIGFDLSGANLTETNLREADLSGADLTGTNLREANLREANLSRANLTGTNLREANLTGTDLTETNLSGANLKCAIVTPTTKLEAKWYLIWELINEGGKARSLREADLSGANLTGINLIGFDLSGANLTGTDFTETNLSGANFREADLSGANLTGTDLREANLSGANLKHAIVTPTTKLEAKWHLIWELINEGGKARSLREADLSGANLTGINLRGFDLSGADLTGTNLREANLSRANLTGTNLRKAKLIGTNLRKANLSGANLTRTNLREANLSGADLTGTKLIGTNLIRAKLIGTDLREANLIATNLREAVLNLANLEEADLTESYFIDAKGLSRSQIKSARNWRTANFDDAVRKQL
jgi:uncharacterized protein YjbI with pentapeptide repeats